MSHIYQLHNCLTRDSISAASSLFSFWLENTLSSPIRILLKRELHFRLQSSENGLAEKIKHLRKDCNKSIPFTDKTGVTYLFKKASNGFFRS